MNNETERLKEGMAVIERTYGAYGMPGSKGWMFPELTLT